MKINNFFKDKNIDFKIGLYIFAIVYYLNVMVHVLGHYVHFISTTVDCSFYAVEIVCIYIAYRSIKVMKCKEFNILYSLLKGIIFAKCIIFTALLTDGMFTILLLPSPFIVIGFEFYFYIALIKSLNRIHVRYCSNAEFKFTLQKYIKLWIRYHIALILALVIGFNVKKLWFFLCLIIIFSSKLYLQYKMIGCLDTVIILTGPLEEANNSKFIIPNFRIPKFMRNRAIKYCSLAAGALLFALLFVVFLIMKNTYSGDLYLVDENGNLATEQKAVDFSCVHNKGFDNKEDIIYQYKVRNMLPWWIGYSDSKYGLLNIKTGDNTGPIYDRYLPFWDNNQAWDGNGHIIDPEGNVLVTIPESIMETRSEIQKIYDDLIYGFTKNDDSYMDYYHRYDGERYGPMICDYRYFYDGIGVYYDDLKGKYGVISDTGELLTDPEYDFINIHEDGSYHNPRCLKAFKDRYKYYLNNRGEVILKYDKSDLFNGVDVNYYCGYINYRQYSDDYRTYENKIVNFDGEVISDKYILDYYSESNNIVTAKSLDKDDKNTYAIGMGGKVLFKSDKYTSYYICIGYKYLIARNTSNMYELIDFNGDQIISGEFTDVLYPYSYNSKVILCRDSANQDYPKEIYLFSYSGKIISFLSLGNEYKEDFGYGEYYDLEQDKYCDYYWRLNTEGKYEIYSIDGILLDTVRAVEHFELANTRPDNGNTSKYPEAVTNKYSYVEYGGYSHYAVSNERLMK